MSEKYLSPDTIEEGRAFIIDSQREAFFKWVERNMSHISPEAVRKAIDKEPFWNIKECAPSSRNAIFVQLVKRYHEIVDEEPDAPDKTLFDHLTE